jgi:hypothetical protein
MLCTAALPAFMNSTGYYRLIDIAFLLKFRAGHKNINEVTESDRVQKEELIHLHTLMMQIKKCYESVANDEIHSERYDSLGMSPLHIHKDKKSHKDAILTLGDEIVAHIHKRSIHSLNNPSDNASPIVAAEH